MSLRLVPIHTAEANAFVRLHHRHSNPVLGARFCVAVADEEHVRGVAICGRPVARPLQDGWTLEVNRLATDGVRNGCSMLYAACWRAAQAIGYTRLVTYTLDAEGGASLRASGWERVAELPARSGWGRHGKGDYHYLSADRVRWEKGSSRGIAPPAFEVSEPDDQLSMLEAA